MWETFNAFLEALGFMVLVCFAVAAIIWLAAASVSKHNPDSE